MTATTDDSEASSEADAVEDQAIRSAVLEVVRDRGPGKTACPSAAARSAMQQSTGTEEGWRGLMPRVRQAARALAEKGELEVTQDGEAVDPVEASGPIRLGLPAPGEGEPEGEEGSSQ